MPIQLDDISIQNAAAIQSKNYNPKFFSSDLTGSGKKVGLLCQGLNPTATPAKNQKGINPQIIIDQKHKIVNGTITTSIIPMSPLPIRAWSDVSILNKPDFTYLTKIADNQQEEIRIELKPFCIIIEQQATGGVNEKKTDVIYQIFLYTQSNKKSTVFETCTNPTAENKFEIIYTTSPANEYFKRQTAFTNYNWDANAWDDFISNYSLYNEVARQSEIWQTSIDQDINLLFQGKTTGNYNIEAITTALKRLEMYTVPLDIYTKIYQNIRATFMANPEIIKLLCKHNLNLLLSDTLTALNNNKANLPCLPPNAVYAKAGQNIFSIEQQNAIASTEPLIMVQAGAGTGKSTVILGRVDHMIGVGVNPNDIMVLSFTNAAADNITDRNASIKSMTIARMIHTIYEANYPNHELSNLDTIRNTIDICYDSSDPIANEFNKLLKKVEHSEAEAFTSLNNFIEDHTDEVIAMLDKIKQTSLELEIIICYQQIDTLIEPSIVHSKYLIVDEVQDNSIFEFIYLLKYISKHNESMFIVGDCSQTLYEFRASNPRALNMLEGSGVFVPYKLQTNYRSNQEILDFANIALRNIEANQFALIQLQANSLKPVTLQSFKEAVTLQYEALNKMREDNQMIEHALRNEIKTWMDDKLAKGETIAFLAYARKKIYYAESILRDIYPNKTIVNLVPEKMYTTNIFTEYIKRYWDDIQFAPKQNIAHIISQGVISKLDYITRDASKSIPIAQNILAKWQTAYHGQINEWTFQVDNGAMTISDFLENIKWTMINFETTSNNQMQALKSQKNADNKKTQQNTKNDIVLSTIHSAKGLEFDNVIVLYQNKSTMDEATKRMYYVALTRAMKSEYILAYDTMVSPLIVSNYDKIIEDLEIAAGIRTTQSTTAI